MSSSTSNSKNGSADNFDYGSDSAVSGYAAVSLFVRWGLRRIPMMAVTFIVLMVMGEGYMRAFFLPSTFYEPDAEIRHTYRPNHQSITWQGNYSVASPPMSFNSEGHRGGETDWNQKTLVALGSSEVMAPGIEDEETWAAQLEKLLRENGDDQTIEVVNAGIEGHGPFHHAIMFDRIIDKHNIDTAIMRASVGDANFSPPTGEASKSALRRFLRDKTMFVRFLVNKSQAQIEPVRHATVPFPLRTQKQRKDPQHLERAKKMWTAYEPYWTRAVESASEKGVRLILLVVNANDWEGEAYLADKLKSLSQDKPNVSVLVVGPEKFGLDGLPVEQREADFKRDFTLQIDPHGNAKQHRIIAEALHEYLTQDQTP